MVGESGLFIARHGQSMWNAQRRWAGHADVPLTEVGRGQALAACEVFASHGFHAVTSSCLSRARETATIIAGELGLTLLDPVPALNERHAGVLTGLTWDEIKQRYPEIPAQFERREPVEIPEGEAWPAFRARVLRAVDELSRDPARPLLAIAHAGVLRAVSETRGDPGVMYRNLEGLWL